MNDRLAWRIAIRESDLDPTAKLVAFTLDTYMDRRGIAWPSKASLAAGAGRDVRTIDRALIRLERAELLVFARSRGRGSNLYCAKLPNPGTSAPVADVPTPASTTPTPAPVSPNPGTSAGGSRKNLSLKAIPTDRARDQNQNQVDPAVVELAHRWIADHRMR